jgi:hypothetical protein
MKTFRIGLVASVCCLLLACSSMSLNANSGPKVYRNVPWVLLPSINNTEAPQAGGRLDSIAATMMRTHGINISLYSVSSQQDDGMFESADRRAQEAALNWARQQGFRYALAGSVDEWHYKAGLDGEPAVGLSLSIIDVGSGQALWSGSVAGTGESQQALSALAQDLVNNLLGVALSRASEMPREQVAHHE